MEDEVINVNGILLDKKSYKNILIYDITYKNFKGKKALRIMFIRVRGLIKIFNGIRYSEVFESNNEFIIEIILEYIMQL